MRASSARARASGASARRAVRGTAALRGSSASCVARPVARRRSRRARRESPTTAGSTTSGGDDDRGTTRPRGRSRTAARPVTRRSATAGRSCSRRSQRSSGPNLLARAAGGDRRSTSLVLGAARAPLRLRHRRADRRAALRPTSTAVLWVVAPVLAILHFLLDYHAPYVESDCSCRPLGLNALSATSRRWCAVLVAAYFALPRPHSSDASTALGGVVLGLPARAQAGEWPLRARRASRSSLPDRSAAGARSLRPSASSRPCSRSPSGSTAARARCRCSVEPSAVGEPSDRLRAGSSSRSIVATQRCTLRPVRLAPPRRRTSTSSASSSGACRLLEFVLVAGCDRPRAPLALRALLVGGWLVGVLRHQGHGVAGDCLRRLASSATCSRPCRPACPARRWRCRSSCRAARPHGVAGAPRRRCHVPVALTRRHGASLVAVALLRGRCRSPGGRCRHPSSKGPRGAADGAERPIAARPASTCRRARRVCCAAQSGSPGAYRAPARARTSYADLPRRPGDACPLASAAARRSAATRAQSPTTTRRTQLRSTGTAPGRCGLPRRGLARPRLGPPELTASATVRCSLSKPVDCSALV